MVWYEDAVVSRTVLRDANRTMLWYEDAVVSMTVLRDAVETTVEI